MMCPNGRGTQPRRPTTRATTVSYQRCNILERMSDRFDGPPRPVLSRVRVTEGHRGAPKVTEVCPGRVPAVSRLCPGAPHA